MFSLEPKRNSPASGQDLISLPALSRRRDGDDGETAPPTGDGANRGGVGGEVDFGFEISD